MFERFTHRARRVVVLAQEEARLLRHQYIGTEHILLGLIHETDGTAARLLESVGLTLEKTRTAVQEMVGLGTMTPTGHIPFTPRTKKALELALRESMRMGDQHIATEHLLLGMLVEGEGVACQVLMKQGLKLDDLRGSLINKVQAGERDPVVGSAPPITPSQSLQEQLEQIALRLEAIEQRLEALEQQRGDD